MNDIHSCHSQCQVPICVANRRIAELEGDSQTYIDAADRLKAERDEYKQRAESSEGNFSVQLDETRRVEAENERLREQLEQSVDAHRQTMQERHVLRKALETHKHSVGKMGRQTTLANVQADEKLWEALGDG